MFSGGGKWEARPGTMAGVYEVRVDRSDRRHYRLFCLLEHDGAATGLGGPSVVLLAGMDKPFRSTFSEREYLAIHGLRSEYLSHVPRSIAR
jgi:hypothetical protein